MINILFGDVGSWENVKVVHEFEDVNPNTVRLLEKEYKYIYTKIKKNKEVMASSLFKQYPKFDVEKILYDLRDMHLIYFVREMK